MFDLVEHLARLTGHHDRDALDAALVEMLHDVLGGGAALLHRCVGDAPQQRWLTRAVAVRCGAVPAAACAAEVTDIDALPLLQAEPLRARCLLERVVLAETLAHSTRTLFPLATEREPLGVLEIERTLPLSDEERRLVQGVARIYQNFVAVLDASERDNLTGLLNRRTFDASFMKSAAGWPEPRVGSAPGGGHWIGVIDIDHFKRVNDRFGHLIGDEVLLLMARLLRSTFRATDRLYRFGGEEFVVLLHCRGEDDAKAAFERLRANVEGYEFPQVGRITISVGISALRAADSPSAAFERADMAVYHAKGHGRNQVCSHADLVAGGLIAADDKVGAVELF